MHEPWHHSGKVFRDAPRSWNVRLPRILHTKAQTHTRTQTFLITHWDYITISSAFLPPRYTRAFLVNWWYLCVKSTFSFVQILNLGPFLLVKIHYNKIKLLYWINVSELLFLYNSFISIRISANSDYDSSKTVECADFTYLVSIVTIDARRTSEMKAGLPWQNRHVTRWRLFSPGNLT